MGIDHQRFNRSELTPVDVQTGYKLWSPVYDQMLTDTVDGPILERFLNALKPKELLVADLGCGTGRNVEWLKKQGLNVTAEGTDCSTEMLTKAREKGIYRNTFLGDLAQNRWNDHAYDLVISVFTACHLARLEDLYETAARLLKPNGHFWIVDMHPHLFLMGKGTVVPLAEGKIYIQNYVHFFRDHTSIAERLKFRFQGFEESFVPESWGIKSENYREVIGHPIGFGFDWTL